MKIIKTAIFGTGFIGRVHLEAARRTDFVDVVAIAGRTREAAVRLGKGFSIAKLAEDYRVLLRDPAIDAIHICTPNAHHYKMAKDALLAGKHVICEKPLATSVEEGEELVALANRQGLLHCVCHNLRYYPMVQQMRRMRECGDFGEILILQGTYFQDWLLYDTDWNWRVDAKIAGPSRCMADIGSHWFDMAEHVSGRRVTSLCADLQTFHAHRKQPKRSLETFAPKPLEEKDYISTPVGTEDFGAVIFRMGGEARGIMSASQVSAGRKNRLSIEVCGTKASVAWSQERPDELWVGRRDEENRICLKDPSLLKTGAREYADLPGGHSEGYDDTFKQLFREFYSALSGAARSNPSPFLEFPTFGDGVRQLEILRAVMESHRERHWVDAATS